MPQGSMSAGFSFTELMHIVLGDIPNVENQFEGMKSVSVANDKNSLPKISFYIDDNTRDFQRSRKHMTLWQMNYFLVLLGLD